MRNILLAAALLAAVPAGAASIVNGSFESAAPGVTPGGSYVTVAGGDSTSIPGWTVGGDSVDLIGGLWQAHAGANSIDVDGNATGALSQTIATVAGNVYTLGFWLAGNPDGGVKSLSVQTSDGFSSPQYDFDTASTSTVAMGWVHRTFTFSAFTNATTVTFQSLTGGASGPALDDVSIADGSVAPGVPEPAVWALLLGGFGTVGGALRRRRATLPALAA